VSPTAVRTSSPLHTAFSIHHRRAEIKRPHPREVAQCIPHTPLVLGPPPVRNLGSWSVADVRAIGVAQCAMIVLGAHQRRAGRAVRLGRFLQLGRADRPGPSWPSGLPCAAGHMVRWTKAMGQIRPAASG
jgi:hypothetical protein